MTTANPSIATAPVGAPRASGGWRYVVRSASGRIGIAILTLVVLVAILGPAFAPHPPQATLAIPGEGSTSASLAGTDYVGRDVLSRLLFGGRSLIIMSLLATALAYGAGASLGMLAGYRSGRSDDVIMRIVDVLLSFPPLLVILVVLAGAGAGVAPLVVAVALVQIPGIARLVRTATLETATRGYVEAALIRGERTAAILRREILPNILPAVLADAGLRVTFSVLLIAAVNFLGLGLQPPASDWGLMISENRIILPQNPLAVLAPALMLALLAVGINLTADAIVRGLGRSGGNSAESRR